MYNMCAHMWNMQSWFPRMADCQDLKTFEVLRKDLLVESIYFSPCSLLYIAMIVLQIISLHIINVAKCFLPTQRCLYIPECTYQCTHNIASLNLLPAGEGNY